ncbi:hypothetical protein N7524_006632, partial [Penicillium chrysogenum]
GTQSYNGNGQLRYNLLCLIGEFVGTFMFLFFSFAGTQVSNTPMPPSGSPRNTLNLLYSALSFRFALTVNVWAFYRVICGLFNPAWYTPSPGVVCIPCVTGRRNCCGGRGERAIPRTAKLRDTTRRRRISYIRTLY